MINQADRFSPLSLKRMLKIPDPALKPEFRVSLFYQIGVKLVKSVTDPTIKIYLFGIKKIKKTFIVIVHNTTNL